MKTERITLNRWFDRHLHLRDHDMLKTVLPCTLAQKATGALVMPNLIPDPITTIERAVAYKKRIQALIPPDTDFKPCMSLYLTDHTDPKEVEEGFKSGAWVAAKLYMANKNGKGGTTGSQHGVRDLKNLTKVFRTMEKIRMPLLGHFEATEDDVDEFDREVVSLDRDLAPLLRNFEGMTVVVEHVTDARMAEYVAEVEFDIQATVTAHHLMINRNALFDGGLNPNHWCKPVAKREKHRQVLRSLVTSGNCRFGAGTDSAPHSKEKKEMCCGCAAGIFTAPHAVELYATVFDEENKLEYLNRFLSRNFVDLYGMQPTDEKMKLVRTPYEIPKMIGPVHVFKGGETLQWKLTA